MAPNPVQSHRDDFFVQICYSLRDQQMLEAMQATIAHANENDNIEYYKTKEGALDYIGTRINAGAMSKEKRIQAAKNVFHKEVLPHIGIEVSDAKAKGYFFGYMCNKLLSCALNRSTSDERDHFANKRCDLAGPLLGSLFKLSLKRLIKNMRKEVQSKLDQNYTIDMCVTITSFICTLRDHFCRESLINDKEISKDITRGLATGNWAVGKDAAPGLAQKTGVAQVLSRLTFAATLSNLRRTNTPIGRDGKMAAPRQLHNTQVLLNVRALYWRVSYPVISCSGA
jgi:DNA-directed RNA polymerase II subunit RPB2